MGYEEAEPPPLRFVGFMGYLSRICCYTFIALRTTKADFYGNQNRNWALYDIMYRPALKSVAKEAKYL